MPRRQTIVCCSDAVRLWKNLCHRYNSLAEKQRETNLENTYSAINTKHRVICLGIYIQLSEWVVQHWWRRDSPELIDISKVQRWACYTSSLGLRDLLIVPFYYASASPAFTCGMFVWTSILALNSLPPSTVNHFWPTLAVLCGHHKCPTAEAVFNRVRALSV